MPGPPGWTQKQQQAAERQRRLRELTTSTPPAHRHAFEVLSGKNIEVEGIVQVNPDSVLFLGPRGPRTAWLRHLSGGGLRVFVEEGFPCEPGPDTQAALREHAG
jgi:hypothetical protein